MKAASLADKAKNLLKAGSSGRYFTQVGSGFTRKRKARLESPSRKSLAYLSIWAFKSYKKSFMIFAPDFLTFSSSKMMPR